MPDHPIRRDLLGPELTAGMPETGEIDRAREPNSAHGFGGGKSSRARRLQRIALVRRHGDELIAARAAGARRRRKASAAAPEALRLAQSGTAGRRARSPF